MVSPTFTAPQVCTEVLENTGQNVQPIGIHRNSADAIRSSGGTGISALNPEDDFCGTRVSGRRFPPPPPPRIRSETLLENPGVLRGLNPQPEPSAGVRVQIR